MSSVGDQPDSSHPRLELAAVGAEVGSGGAWPRLSFERRIWDEEPGPGMSRRERDYRGRSYLAAVTPQIADRPVVISVEVLADADDATIEVARFDAEMGGEIAPFASILLRTESASSSQIENLTASARAIAEAEVTGLGRGNARIVAANTQAMRSAIDLADRLDEDAILAMHEALLRPSAPEIAGHWRDGQVWIGGSLSTPQSADFVPPHSDRVPQAIHDLVGFMARNDIPVMAQASIAHAAFETIHPFPDGNGRTGRALLHALLRGKGVTRNVTVPVSSGLLHDKDDYYAALDAYRAGRPDDIVRTMSAAARRAVVYGRTVVADVRQVRESWSEALGQVRKDSAAHRLADGLIQHPVIKAETAADLAQVDAGNVHRYIKTLVDAGILSGHQDYKTRNMIWRAQDVLDVLDRYSEAVGRRP